MTTTMQKPKTRVVAEQRCVVAEHVQGGGMKPTSGASPRIKVVRLSDGEGEARRKAGLLD